VLNPRAVFASAPFHCRLLAVGVGLLNYRPIVEGSAPVAANTTLATLFGIDPALAWPFRTLHLTTLGGGAVVMQYAHDGAVPSANFSDTSPLVLRDGSWIAVSNIIPAFGAGTAHGWASLLPHLGALDISAKVFRRKVDANAVAVGDVQYLPSGAAFPHVETLDDRGTPTLYPVVGVGRSAYIDVGEAFGVQVDGAAAAVPYRPIFPTIALTHLVAAVWPITDE